MIRFLLVSCLLLLPCAALGQDAPADQALDLGAPFEDHAVLQRGVPVPVWGWAEPGMRVAVTFAGQTRAATAGIDGRWLVHLDALEANSTGGAMSISTEHGHRVVLQDILVGEVWVASGQSNMQWLASACDVGRVLQRRIAARVEAGEEEAPVIREAKITDVFSALHPIEHANAELSSDPGGFSAIAFAFAYKLYQELGVPIGILNCSFSQTSIEAWTPREGFAAGEDELAQDIYQRILETDPSTPEHRAAWDAYYQRVNHAIVANDQRIAAGQDAVPVDLRTPGNLNGNRDASWLYNARMHPMVPYAVRGAIWNQGYANAGGGLDYYSNLHSMIRGWRMAWGNPDMPVYFHQFYSADGGGELNHPSIGPTAEMRLGTWLARDIPHTGMASQIDIQGSIHYYNKALPGQRLALHALRHQYGQDIIADGPMFRAYSVEGNHLIVEFDHAQGGFVVAESGTSSRENLALPTVIEDGADQLQLFFIADADRVWHRATAQIDGERVVLTAPGVDSPRGVSYGTGGVGFQPNIYNNALLPMTPFIYYDNELVTRDAWPEDVLQIAGYEPDPNAGGLLYEYRKMPILSAQFRENAVLQHGTEVTIWGSAVHNWGYEAVGEAVIHFSFGEYEATIPVTSGMREWSVTLPPMAPTTEGRTLRAALTIDGDLAHERIAEGVVVGDVWYVASPGMSDRTDEVEAADGIVRVMTRRAKRDSFPSPSRFSVCVSTTPLNRFACTWEDAPIRGLPGAIAHCIAARSGGIPVGVIFMQNLTGRDGVNPPLSAWMPFSALANAPSLSEDLAVLGALYPGAPSYNQNVAAHLEAWRTFWSEYIPVMIAERRVPDQAAWGQLPTYRVGNDTTEATQSYNTMTHCFTPAALRGILFLTSPTMLSEFTPEQFQGQMSVLANSWLDRFGGETCFLYTVPGHEYVVPHAGPGPIEGNSAAGVYQLAIDPTSGHPIAEQGLLDAIGSIMSHVCPITE